MAALVIVAYNGIQGRATTAGLQADMNAAVKIVENARTTAGTSAYVANQAAAQAAGLNSSVTYVNGTGLGGFCVSKTTGTTTYMATATNKAPHTGPGCTLINLISNPGIEASAVGWTAAANSTVVRSVTFAANGAASLVITHPNVTAGNAYGTIPITTVVGTRYEVSFAIRSHTGSATVNASVRNGSAVGTIPADSSSQSITPNSSFQRYIIDFTAESTTTNLVVDITGTTSGQAVAIDSVMATVGENAGAYADPQTAPGVWTWSTTDPSTSTGPAF
ncbi:carbohydrate binding domain-containing protein [Candidatus Saccharibacteria bacterium]|nr:carbohydrate binding domain-containing protein [Candidatus Saccharibacteria bacterium]